MAQVDWITYKTDPQEIIKPNEVKEKIEDYFSEYENIINLNLKEPLEKEITVGGLDKFSLNILGEAPANTVAINILDYCDEIKSSATTLIEKVYKEAEEQKQIEKKQLQDAIMKKIALVKEEWRKAKAARDSYQAAFNSDPNHWQGDYNSSGIESQQLAMNSCTAEIEKLQEKYNVVSAL